MYRENVRSPTRILNTILDQTDNSKKQYDIVRFAENINFAGAAVFGSGWKNLLWFYCVDTNLKLIPKFLYDLAKAYIMGDDYAHVWIKYVAFKAC
jgi:hypothetical protein